MTVTKGENLKKLKISQATIQSPSTRFAPLLRSLKSFYQVNPIHISTRLASYHSTSTSYLPIRRPCFVSRQKCSRTAQLHAHLERLKEENTSSGGSTSHTQLLRVFFIRKLSGTSGSFPRSCHLRNLECRRWSGAIVNEKIYEPVFC